MASHLVFLQALLHFATSPREHRFPALRAVEFATYHPDASWEAMLKEHYALHSEWVRCMLPRLHERGIVEVYVYGCVAPLLRVLSPPRRSGSLTGYNDNSDGDAVITGCLVQGGWVGMRVGRISLMPIILRGRNLCR